MIPQTLPDTSHTGAPCCSRPSMLAPTLLDSGCSFASLSSQHSSSNSTLSSALLTLQRVQSKVCRYRHHIVNLQTYLSCQTSPKGFRSTNPIALDLDQRELGILRSLQAVHGSTLLQLALACARRNFHAATSACWERLQSIEPHHRPIAQTFLFHYSSRLDKALAAVRLKKWRRDGVTPKPLSSTFTCTPRRRGTRAGRCRRRRNCENASPNPATVVNLSSHTLSAAEQKLLNKGLTFCPINPVADRLQLTADLHSFYRRLRLKDYFAGRPDTSSSWDSALKHTALAKKSQWQPPKGCTAPETEVFIKVFHDSICQALVNSCGTAPTRNLSPDELQALHDLQRREDLVIRPADKGSAIVIQDADAYHREITRQLTDSKFYKPLDEDPTNKHQAIVRKTVLSMKERGTINDKTAQDLIETKVRSPHFYTLPKIHKRLADPPGRPIVSSYQTPTERISAYVDLTLKPLVRELPSYIMDTKDFLRQLQSLPSLPPNAIVFTMDVVGLYNNIPHKDGLKACTTMLERRAEKTPPTGEVIQLARLVLELNAFQYQTKYYLQIHGTAMGTRMAPNYANLFMACLEERLLTSAPGQLVPAFYKRFIDDIFGIWLHGEEALLCFLQHANSLHPDIKFTSNYGSAVNFLDALVKIRDSFIVTDLYTKATDTHQYLSPSSDHPQHVHRNLPYGLGLRLRVIVSEDETFETRLQELRRHLALRGYSNKVINEQFAKVRSISREVALQRRKVPTNERTPLVTRWHSCWPGFAKLLRQAFPILTSSERLQRIIPLPLVSFLRPTNLRNLLVHTKPASQLKPTHPTGLQVLVGTYPCKSPRCKTCAAVHNRSTVELGDQQHKIRGHHTCKSTSVVYLISCSACDALYVGETGCMLRDRMTGHRSAIKRQDDTPVAEHFGQASHDFRVAVLESSPPDVIKRRALEKVWIARLRKANTNIINRDDGVDLLLLPNL